MVLVIIHLDCSHSSALLNDLPTLFNFLHRPGGFSSSGTRGQALFDYWMKLPVQDTNRICSLNSRLLAEVGTSCSLAHAQATLAIRQREAEPVAKEEPVCRRSKHRLHLVEPGRGGGRVEVASASPLFLESVLTTVQSNLYESMFKRTSYIVVY